MTQRLDDRDRSKKDDWVTAATMDGGPLDRISHAVGLQGNVHRTVAFGLAFALLTWIPLFVLCVFDGTLVSGPAIPFKQSLGTHVRLLLAIPMAFLAEALFTRRAEEAVRAIVSSQLVPARQLPALAAALAAAQRWRTSWTIEAGLLVAVIAIVASGGLHIDFSNQLSTWRHSAGRLTPAGWWYITVSLPAFHFLIGRWSVRLLIWVAVLWRLTRLDLQLVPTHPDRAAGLGVLGIAHLPLAPLNFAAVSVLVATYAEEILYGGADVNRIVLPLAVAIVAGTAALAAPLLMFMPKLIDAKERGQLDYGELAAQYSHGFEAKWLRGGHDANEQLLGSADVQSLADMASAFDIIRDMRIVPMSGRQFLWIVLIGAVPAAPLILLVIPLDELITRIVRTLLNI